MKSLWRAIRNNWSLKCLSLLLAIALWAYVISAEAPQIERVLPVSLKLENLDTGLAVTQLPPSISLRLHTPVRMNLDPESISAYLNLEGLGAGSWTLPVQVKPIPGATLLEMRPDTVNLLIEKVESKALKVEIAYVGQLPQGFILGTPTLTPTEVSVKAPSGELQKAHRVLIPVNLADVRSQITQTSAVQVVDVEGKTVPGLQIDPSTVNLSIPVNLSSLFKTVPITPKLQGALAPGYLVKQVIADPAVATLEGTVDVLGKIAHLSTSPVALNGQSADFRTWVNLDTTGVEARLTETGPVQVDVLVEEQGLAQFEVPLEAIGSDRTVHLGLSSVIIKAGGTRSQVDMLTALDFQASVQVGNLPPGIYSLAIQVLSPPGVFLIQVSTPTVEARIE
jgi:YbbR domain-containing protein